jgi:hypothetical protein
MSEINQVTFSHKEVAEALIRYNNIHDGLWGLYVEFGLAGANVSLPPEGNLNPTAVVPIVKLGLQRFKEPNTLTADASVVNPAAKPASKKR